MEQELRLSVIIPTYNRADAIGLTLTHLGQQSLPVEQFEVLVVDDGSSDGTDTIVGSLNVPFTLRYFKQDNHGVAATRNLGVKKAKGEVILFLDCDVVPDKELLTTHLNYQRNEERRLVVGRVKPWPEINNSWYEQLVKPEVGMDYGDNERPVPFYMALGGNFSILKKYFHQIGGYDETFPAAGCEETEFAYRAERAGYPLYYQPQAVGYHNHPRTLAQRLNQQEVHMRSMALLIKKHPHLQTVIFGVDELMPVWKKPLSLQSVYRRGKAKMVSSLPMRYLMFQSLKVFNQLEIFPRITSLLFWQLIIAAKCKGFRAGLQQYGMPQ